MDRFGPTGKVSKKNGPPFEVVLFSRSDRSEVWLNGSRPGTKNCCVIEAAHVSKESLGKIKFRAFPKRVGPRILSLESVDYFGTSKHYGTLLSGDRKNN